MATITSYSTLTQAIADYTHRSDLTAGGTPFSDYFIQAALEQIQQDIPDMNFGNYIRPMESAYGPVAIQSGITPVPQDWLGAKVLTISDGSSDTWPLLVKAASWLYGTYPIRQPSGLPAYIARDVVAPATFTGTILASATMDSGSITMDSSLRLDAGGEYATGSLIVSSVASGILQPGMVISGASLPTAITSVITILGQLTGSPGGSGTYLISNPQAVSVPSEAMTGGGPVFVFGPYPDSSYEVGGTYYSAIPSLSSSSPTNWVTSTAPALLLAACMVEAAHFISDDALLSRWSPKYQQKLKALVDMDKAERWASGTMAIEVA